MLARLAVDTGATGSLMNVDLLVLLGYDPSTVLTRVRVATASGVESLPRLAIERIAALDHERHQFPVV